MIFKAVREGRPYPDHGFSSRDWALIAPRSVRLDELITTKRQLALDTLLDDQSTFYGDLFPHAVRWNGEIYLEDGVHRALRAALQQRHTLHVRVLDLDVQTRRAVAVTDAFCACYDVAPVIRCALPRRGGRPDSMAFILPAATSGRAPRRPPAAGHAG